MMTGNRRGFLKTLAAGAMSSTVLPGVEADAGRSANKGAPVKTIPIGLVQCDSVAEQVERNLDNMERLAEEAAKSGARWIMFHELTVCDYANQPGGLAELVPQGVSTTRMGSVAARLGMTLAFGTAEKDHGRIYDSQIFVGPHGYFYHYRKTWLWYAPKDESYRNEWSRYDP